MGRRRRARAGSPDLNHAAVTRPPQGGRLTPLKPNERDRIVDAAFEILARTGLDAAPDWLAALAREAGASQGEDGRLRFARPLVERALGRAARNVSLPGFEAERGLAIGGGHVHIGTGGAAVEMLDAGDLGFREARLADLHRLMRIVDLCEHIHYGVRPVVARDMASPLDLDLNTAFACLKATAKPIGVSFYGADHVAATTRLFDMALGGPGRFARQPFAFAVIVHAVSPLRFAGEGVDIMRAAIGAGMPLQICTAGQAGATSPVTLAGALAQGLAETLGGLMAVDLIRPGAPCVFALMPFVSDLRTGAMTGGGGEAAVAQAAAAQLLRHLELPATVSAGMTDAKLMDAQAGYEKGYTVALAAQAGADMINLSVGMLGSIMAASAEALVIDNDMCGAILRSVRGVEAGPGDIDLDTIDAVATGVGHYLGEPETLARMKTEYVYPRLGDRMSIADWREAGGRTIWERAIERVAELDAVPATHLPAKREAAIRAAFDIHLREELQA